MTKTNFIFGKSGLITFDNNAKTQILAMFGKIVDKGGYIVEMANPAQRVLTPDGEDITLDEFAGIKMCGGVEILIKNDLAPVLKLIDEIRLENLQDGKKPENGSQHPEKFVYVDASNER